ncbi:MAG: hypothetical protein SGJ11_04025 [Phycisphaerae bacterium]|nr:hypothetical protein [Phycisphaerae bacterium]
MKWFWIFLGVLIAIAIVVTLRPPRHSRIDPRALQAGEALAEEAARAVSASSRPVSPQPVTDPGAAAVAPAASDSARELVQDLLTPRAKAAGTAVMAELPIPTPDGERIEEGLDRVLPNATVVRGTLIRAADGSIVADRKFVLRGKGTEDDPIVVPWELLTSAMDTYQPRSGLKEIPQRIAFLDGKRIRIDGYLAFPLIAQQATQLLVTFNQWDGCCIGVPPTAFDALEVTLASSIPVNRRHGLLFGSVTGIFKVEPLLSGSYLIGMYLLDDASIKVDL